MRILLVEDDKLLTDGFDVLFKESAITTVRTGAEAIEKLRSIPYNILFLDIRLEDSVSGIEVLKTARVVDPLLPVIMMSGHDDKETMTQCLELGAVDYLVKGSVTPAAYKFAVNKASVWRKQQAEIGSHKKYSGEEMTKALESIKGESESIKSMRAKISLLGKTEGPFLISGETGTGKELIARALWAAMGDKNRPYISVNCAQFQATTIEGELFGYEKGTFTGANGQKIGLFEAAHGGDIFLDEIGELPLEFQAKLLRVLQEKKIRRMGATEERVSEFRLIAATNRNLGAEVELGNFREDLLYRLDVQSIQLDPLRNRADDISILLCHFLKEKGLKGLSVDEKVVSGMAEYLWPGNIRQLSGFVKFVTPYLDKVDPCISESIWASWVAKQRPAKDSTESGVTTGIVKRILAGDFNYDEFSESLRKTYISTAMGMTQNNKTTAAKMLGVSRQRLQKWLQEDLS